MGNQEVELGAIIRAYQGGDPLALDEVIRRLKGPLLRLATCVLRDPVTAEDAFIESMTRLLPTLRTFDNPDRFAAYARKTVRNHCVDLLRRRADRDLRRALRTTRRAAAPWTPAGAFVEGLPADGRSPEQELLLTETLERLRAGVERLGEPDRTILELTYREELTCQEVARTLRLTPSKVKRTLGQARVKLASWLRKGGVDDAS